MVSQSELERRLADVEARETEVAKRERALETKGLRHNLYDRITLSPRAIDAVIVACAVAIVALVIAGRMLGGGS